MKQMEDYINQESFDISIDEFDAIDEKHEFSKEYKENKKNMLKEYRKNKLFSGKSFYKKVAIASFVVLLSAPIAVNAATDGELFNRIWGNSTKEDIEAHDEVIESDGQEITVSYPEREYVSVDEKEAERLVGDYLFADPITTEFDGTTVTIKSAICDQFSVVVEITLEKEGGVDILDYDKLSNESYGAWFKPDASFGFYFKEALGDIYVDMNASTKEKVVCYYYMVKPAFFSDGSSKLTMYLMGRPCDEEWLNTDPELAKADSLDEIRNQLKYYPIEIPMKDNVSMVDFVGEKGTSLKISPISMNIQGSYEPLDLDCMKDLVTIANQVAVDNLYNLEITYKDGSVYKVYEKEKEGVYTSDKYIDNTSYICGVEDDKITVLFNRLVDVDNIESITVNDDVLKLAK